MNQLNKKIMKITPISTIYGDCLWIRIFNNHNINKCLLITSVISTWYGLKIPFYIKNTTNDYSLV